jgi:hypothetical protein
MTQISLTVQICSVCIMSKSLQACFQPMQAKLRKDPSIAKEPQSSHLQREKEDHSAKWLFCANLWSCLAELVLRCNPQITESRGPTFLLQIED